ncbi:MAG: ABC transporter permease subunit [Chlorobi bacterium]|nr:MAG: peptide/nickel transport system permease protein [Chlorobi bacterium OLB7]MBK8910764.1 ABC transporter permease subunit [Chlorobiota bacterium]MBX7217327.1 ABC transporter permease subunit [Candidatus Kapabacteria bacterium]
MLNYFIRRFLLVIPTFLVATMVVFAVLQYTPGGPFEQIEMQMKQRMMSGEASGGGGGLNSKGDIQIPEQAKEELMKYFNLDKPVPIRYLHWLGNIATGDFGTSYIYSEPVLTVVTSRFPVSIFYGVIGFVLTYLVCIPLGIMKAVKHSSTFDVTSSAIVFVGYSIPGWALGAVLLVTLGGTYFPLGEFRSSGWEYMSTWDKIMDQLHHAVLPLCAYMIGNFATLTILMKNSLLENLGQDYVRTAFAKGLTERRVIFVHALRNSLIPIATGLGGLLGVIFAGSFLIEKVFNINGLGLVGYRAVVERDYAVVMGTLVFGLAIQLTGNIFSDMLYVIIDPRIKFR